jgi:hypothetical protein
VLTLKALDARGVRLLMRKPDYGSRTDMHCSSNAVVRNVTCYLLVRNGFVDLGEAIRLRVKIDEIRSTLFVDGQSQT